MMTDYQHLSRLQYTPTIQLAYTKHPSGASMVSAHVRVPRGNAGWLIAGVCLGVGVGLLLSRE